MSYQHLIYLISSLLIVSCGLNYTPPETPESQTLQRQKAIQNHLIATLQNDSTAYKSLAFGKTETLKPTSFVQLDSLYHIKYTLEKQGKRNKDLEEEILIQRQIALIDTNGLIFKENHLFTLTSKKVTTVYSSELTTNSSNQIKDVALYETTIISPGNLELFQIYTFEESFLQPGFKPLPDEIQFYNKYKSHAKTLTGDLKDKFVQTILGNMRAAQKIQTLKTVPLLSEIIREDILGNTRALAKNETFVAMEELYELINGEEVFTGYYVRYEYQRIENGLTTSFRYGIKVSPFLEILSKGLY
jgi:hypothetical protein